MTETWLEQGVFFLVRIVEACGASIIFLGAVFGFLRFLYASVCRRLSDFKEIRMGTGTFLALGLEFQLAADLLRTTVAPSFEEIGKLAAVAAIRTALNFFLAREIAEERREIRSESRDGVA